MEIYLVLAGNFRKFSHITGRLGTTVYLNENMHTMPVSTINHKY